MSIRNRITFGPLVRGLREGFGMNQAGLAKAVGVSATCVWNWEKGNTYPRPEQMTKLARALHTTEEYLKSGDLRKAPGSAPPRREERAPVGVSEIINYARHQIAEAAGLDIAQVRVVLDYGG